LSGDLEGIIQDGDGNAFLITEFCTFGCRFVYFYYTENRYLGNGFWIQY